MPGERSARWAEEETIALCSFVKSHRSKLFGKAGHCSAKVEARKQKYWRMAAEVLSRECGRQRSWVEVRKKWIDSKVRANNYECLKNKTGGGPEPKVKPALEAVLEAMAPQSRHGIVGPSTEIGFSQSSVSSESTDDEEACATLRKMITHQQSLPTPETTSSAPQHQPATPEPPLTTPQHQPATPELPLRTPKPTSKTTQHPSTTHQHQPATPEPPLRTPQSTSKTTQHPSTTPQHQPATPEPSLRTPQPTSKTTHPPSRTPQNPMTKPKPQSSVAQPASKTTQPPSTTTDNIRSSLLEIEEKKLEYMKEGLTLQQRQIDLFEEMMDFLKAHVVAKSDE